MSGSSWIPELEVNLNCSRQEGKLLCHSWHGTKHLWWTDSMSSSSNSPSPVTTSIYSSFIFTDLISLHLVFIHFSHIIILSVSCIYSIFLSIILMKHVISYHIHKICSKMDWVKLLYHMAHFLNIHNCQGCNWFHLSK